MPSFSTTLFLVTLFVVLAPLETYAFGAGDIPDFSYLNNKAFRHGDIENILTELAKAAGKGAAGGGILGIASSIFSGGAGGGKKFNKGDVKKVYFGNWLRDYSQAMDIAGLSKLSGDTIVLIVGVLGFMTFGFATEEFEVTKERLSVYLPVEHIDNPKGYAEKEGDARQFHPWLRPPVNPRELEIDPRNGMKNYMASDNQGWDTSTAHIRRTLRACIDHGRRAKGEEGADLWEAYRLLGTGLHTLEDLLAHSNWCEIALRKMGHEQVFCHVGDAVVIDTPNGQAPPLVTGTFGSADFMHSMMGEATDHISQASVTDLSQKMSDASSGDQESNLVKLKGLLSKLSLGGGGGDGQIDTGEDLHNQSKAYRFDPNNVAPPEVQHQLWALLKWRDSVYRAVIEKIEMIPGLTDLIDGITDALNAYVYTILAPWLTPILTEATEVLGVGSKAVIDSDDQYEVFNNPHASDPSHSLLSKDHFGLILNEPAGKIAQVVVQHSTKLLVEAWFNDRTNPDQVIDQILEAFHHPYFNTGRSQIQNEMFQEMERWLSETGEDRDEILESLTKASVREGKNKRKGSEDETAETPGGAHGHGAGAFVSSGQYTSSGDYLSQGGQAANAYGRQSESGREEAVRHYGGSSYDNDKRQEQSYGQTEQGRRDDDSGNTRQDDSYGSSRPSYGQESQGYGGESRSNYGQGQESSGYGRQTESYEESRPSQGGGYGREESRTTDYGRSGGYDKQEISGGYQPSSEQQPSYEQQQPVPSGYGREEREEQRPSYGEEPSYGEQRRHGGGDQYEQPARRQQQSYGGDEYEQPARRHEHSYGGDESEQPTRRQEQSYESSGYGGRQTGYGRSESEREEPGAYVGQQRGGYGGSEEPSGYGQSQGEYRSSHNQESESGYGGSTRREETYGEGRAENRDYYAEDSQETFGAERLKINEEEPGEEYGERRGGGGYRNSDLYQSEGY